MVITELGQAWIEKPLEQVKSSLKANGVSFETINGARPNAPRGDVYRINLQVARSKSDMIVALGGGSTLDAAKASAILNKKPAIEDETPEYANSDGCGKRRCGSIDEAGLGSRLQRGFESDSLIQKESSEFGVKIKNL